MLRIECVKHYRSARLLNDMLNKEVNVDARRLEVGIWRADMTSDKKL